MRFLRVVVLCCFSAGFLKASEVLEVSGYVGGDVSIHCPGGWTTDNRSQHNGLYFCKGRCSRNVLIQSERGTTTVTRGRYRLEVNREHGFFYVVIRGLTRADAGMYCCGEEKTTFNAYQDISLTVLSASAVPAGPPPSTTVSLQTHSFLSSTDPAASALPATEKPKQRAAASLTDTTVVIIVSVSLALLVCAVIPLIFYGHWRSNAGRNRQEENKSESAVRLQSLEPAADPESGARDATPYAAAYQPLDPKTLD